VVAGDPHLTLVGCALGETPGEAEFFEEPTPTETSSLAAGLSRPGARRRRVPVSTLDAELARAGWPAVDWVKIDAEGFDLAVIRGAAQSLAAGRIRFLQFEYNTSWALGGFSLGEALQRLAAAGYTCRLVRGDGLHRVDYPRWRDFFGFAIFLACRSTDEARLGTLTRHDPLL
jgi:FkbM family methyltransferase